LNLASQQLLIASSYGLSNPPHGAAIRGKRPDATNILTLSDWPLAGQPFKKAPKSSNTISKGGKHENL
jgi:hypothetical protein